MKEKISRLRTYLCTSKSLPGEEDRASGPQGRSSLSGFAALLVPEACQHEPQACPMSTMRPSLLWRSRCTWRRP